jgi:hypothetical protein
MRGTLAKCVRFISDVRGKGRDTTEQVDQYPMEEDYTLLGEEHVLRAEQGGQGGFRLLQQQGQAPLCTP